MLPPIIPTAEEAWAMADRARRRACLAGAISAISVVASVTLSTGGLWLLTAVLYSAICCLDARLHHDLLRTAERLDELDRVEALIEADRLDEARELFWRRAA